MRSFRGAAAALLLAACVFMFAAQEVLADAKDDVLVFERQGWIFSSDGNGRKITRLVQGSRPGITPDGRLVAFFRPDPDDASESRFDLWVYDRKRGLESRIVSSLPAASSAVWSSDGARIAFLARNSEALTRVVTVNADGSKLRTLLREGDGNVGFLCSLSFTPEDELLVHDMSSVYWVNPGGGVLRSVPLDRVMGSVASSVTSSDRFAVCPVDPAVLVFSHAVSGTPRFEAIMHEPSSGLSLHDSWVGVGKNMRITPQDVTAFDPVWSRDGKRIYFVGYRDVQAADAELFRIFRIDRFGSGLKELVLGESVAVGSGFAGGQ